MRCSRTEPASRSRRWSAALALIASGVAFSAAGAQQGKGSIRGVVTDTAGRPMVTATVAIHGTDRWRQLTNGRGEFTLDSVPAGRHVVRLSLIGAYPQLDTVDVEAGRSIERRYAMRMMPLAPPETLPPRYARGARPDTAPDEAELLDGAARMAGLPLLRQQRAGSRHRELRLWYGGGIAIPYSLIRITIDGDRVQGEVHRWLEDVITPRHDDPRWKAFIDSVPTWLQSKFGCGPVATDTLRYGDDLLVAVCESRFRQEPDWRGLLRELEAHRVWTLPDESELPTLANIINIDGGGVTVEAWNGTRYHTYEIGGVSPVVGPEAREGEAIQRILIAFLNRTHADLR